MAMPAGVNFVYPLERVLEIKYRRVEEAEKVVKQKQEALEKEQEKLKEREKARNKAKQHKIDKLNQLRQEMDSLTTSPKIQQMKAYLKVAEEKLKIEERKVNDQKEQVKIAEANLEAAKKELKKKRLDVDKMESHKKDWMHEALQEFLVEEGRELDEIGNIMFLSQRRQKLK